MSAHHTIGDEMIKGAAELADASVLDVRRVVLGMPTLDINRARIISALVSLGADRRFSNTSRRSANRSSRPTGARPKTNTERDPCQQRSQ